MLAAHVKCFTQITHAHADYESDDVGSAFVLEQAMHSGVLWFFFDAAVLPSSGFSSVPAEGLVNASQATKGTLFRCGPKTAFEYVFTRVFHLRRTAISTPSTVEYESVIRRRRRIRNRIISVRDGGHGDRVMSDERHTLTYAQHNNAAAERRDNVVAAPAQSQFPPVHFDVPRACVTHAGNHIYYTRVRGNKTHTTCICHDIFKVPSLAGWLAKRAFHLSAINVNRSPE